MLSRRYVAPPELHEVRVVDPSSAFSGHRGTFVTMYTICQDPAETVAAMSTLRDKLYAEERMRFPPEKKVVRDGDAMVLESALSSAELRLPAGEVPFLGHTGMLVIQRSGPPPVDEWYRREWAPEVVAVDGVHGVMTLRSSRQADARTDLVLFEGDAVEQTRAIRARIAHHPEARLMVDAPFLLIEPLRYPWAESIRHSFLPSTVA
jgi:hypothetical protein